MPSLDWLQNGALIMAVAGLVTAASAAFVNIRGHTQKALIETIGVLREEVKEAKARERETLEAVDEERERTQDLTDALRRSRSEATNEVSALCDTIVVAKSELTKLLYDVDLPADDLRHALKKVCDRLTTARK
jgi:hypothetical protein